MFENIISNVVSYPITFLLGFISGRMYVWMRGLRRKKYLKKIFASSNGKIVLCHTALKDQNGRYDVPLGDLQVCLKIKMELIHAGLTEEKNVLLVPHFDFYDQTISSLHDDADCLIIVGGPKHNKIAEYFFSHHAPDTRYMMEHDTTEDKNIIRDTTTGNIIREQPKTTTSGKDFGIFISTPVDFKGFKRCVTLLGIHGSATMGIMQELFKKENLRKLYHEMDDSITKLLQVEYHNGYLAISNSRFI